MAWTLHEGDSRLILPTLPAASVDAIVCDPPYPCIDRSYGRWTEEEWSALMDPVVTECRRVLKPRGSAVFILQPNSERVGRMRLWLWRFLVKWGERWGVVQDAYWWNYTALPEAHAIQGKLMRPSLKHCVWLGPPDCWRDQSAVMKDAEDWRKQTRPQGRIDFPSGQGVDYRRMQAAKDSGLATPFNVLPFPRGDRAGESGHTASTPLALMRWWIRYICPPGGVVCDPFSGSGAAGLAANCEGRDSVMIEVDPDYCAVIRRRMAEADGPLFPHRGVTLLTTQIPPTGPETALALDRDGRLRRLRERHERETALLRAVESATTARQIRQTQFDVASEAYRDALRVEQEANAALDALLGVETPRSEPAVLTPPSRMPTPRANLDALLTPQGEPQKQWEIAATAEVPSWTPAQQAMLDGYDGTPCPSCGESKLVRSGTQFACDSCGLRGEDEPTPAGWTRVRNGYYENWELSRAEITDDDGGWHVSLRHGGEPQFLGHYPTLAGAALGAEAEHHRREKAAEEREAAGKAWAAEILKEEPEEDPHAVSLTPGEGGTAEKLWYETYEREMIGSHPALVGNPARHGPGVKVEAERLIADAKFAVLWCSSRATAVTVIARLIADLDDLNRNGVPKTPVNTPVAEFAKPPHPPAKKPRKKREPKPIETRNALADQPAPTWETNAPLIARRFWDELIGDISAEGKLRDATPEQGAAVSALSLKVPLVKCQADADALAVEVRRLFEPPPEKPHDALKRVAQVEEFHAARSKIPRCADEPELFEVETPKTKTAQEGGF